MSHPKPVEVDVSPETNRKRLPLSEGQTHQEVKKQRTEEGSLNPMASSSQATGFDDLPDELIFKIFANLETEDLLLRVPRVSKRFYRLSQDPDAHVSVQFPELNELSAEKAIEFLKGKNKIRDVKIDLDTAWSTVVFKLAVMDQKVTTSLNLIDSHFTSLAMLKKSPEKAKQIRMLNLFTGDLGDLVIPTCVIPELVNLIEFEYGSDIINNPHDEKVGKLVSRIAKKSEKLESLSSSNSLTVKQLKKILKRHGKRLKKFCLPYSCVMPEMFIEELISLQKLEDVMCSGSKLSMNSVIGLLRLDCLRAVRIHSFTFCGSILKEIVHLINRPNVKMISLHGHQPGGCLSRGRLHWTPEVLLEIFRALTERKDVKELDFDLRQDFNIYNGLNYEGRSSTELRLEKGEKFFLSANSGFLPKEKLADLIHCLTSSSTLPPMATVEVVYDIALPIEEVTNLKRLLPGDPTVIAKVSI